MSQVGSWQRRLNFVYLAFFIIHVPVMLLIDLVPFYPASLVPSVSKTIRQYYIDTYRDRFFISPPNWFNVYLTLEAMYHLPITFWMIHALWHEHPMLPLQLLIFALETGITTLTCLVEMWSWEGYTADEVSKLCYLYGPYLAFAIIMGIDSYARLHAVIRSKAKLS